MGLLQSFRRWRAKRTLLRAHKAWLASKRLESVYGPRLPMPAGLDVGAAINHARLRAKEKTGD